MPTFECSLQATLYPGNNILLCWQGLYVTFQSSTLQIGWNQTVT